MSKTPVAREPLEIILSPDGRWIFKLSNKGLKQLKLGMMFEKKFVSEKGSLIFTFCHDDAFDKKIKPALDRQIKVKREQLIQAQAAAKEEAQKIAPEASEAAQA